MIHLPLTAAFLSGTNLTRIESGDEGLEKLARLFVKFFTLSGKMKRNFFLKIHSSEAQQIAQMNADEE